jgi:type II secretory pathway component PulK
MRNARRRGVIFVTTLGIMVVLGALLLVFAQSMRTEAIASANRLASSQADAVEQGAEQWVLANVEEYTTDAVSITQLPAEAIPVGDGYFWILRPNQQSNSEYDFGIDDEAGKLNLNATWMTNLAGPNNPLALLPGMTQDIADAMLDWRNPAGEGSMDGAESDYYGTLPEPYQCKNAAYETVEEVLLVKGVTTSLLYGQDVNRNGVIDPGEQNNSGAFPITLTGGQDTSRGIINFLTVYSTTAAATGVPAQVGQVNVNTASEQVLMCLPGLTQTDADNIIAARPSTTGTTSTSNTDLSWVASAIGQQKYQTLVGTPTGGPGRGRGAPGRGATPGRGGVTVGAAQSLITGSSSQYSADILAVSGNGRSYKRVFIVVDVTQTPAKIVYRKDLTSLGWPLTSEVRNSLRSGQGVPADFGGDGTVGNTTPSAGR